MKWFRIYWVDDIPSDLIQGNTFTEAWKDSGYKDKEYDLIRDWEEIKDEPKEPVKRFCVYWLGDYNDKEPSIIEGTSFDDAFERAGFDDYDFKVVDRWEEIKPKESISKSGFFVLSIGPDGSLMSSIVKNDKLYHDENEAEEMAKELAKKDQNRIYCVCSIRSRFQSSVEVKKV